MSVHIKREYFTAGSKDYDVIAIMGKESSLVIRRWGKIGQAGQMRQESFDENGMTAAIGMYQKYVEQRRKKAEYEHVPGMAVNRKVSGSSEAVNMIENVVGAEHMLTLKGTVIAMFNGDDDEDIPEDVPVPVMTEEVLADGEGYESNEWGTW